MQEKHFLLDSFLYCFIREESEPAYIYFSMTDDSNLIIVVHFLHCFLAVVCKDSRIILNGNNIRFDICTPTDIYKYPIGDI